MPIYEYVCSACGHDLEVMQSISEAPLKTCPACKRRTLKKMVSAAGFALKGTGWYVTDFRDKGKKKDDKKKDAAAGDAAKDKASKASKADKEHKAEKAKKESTEKGGGKKAAAE
jgi:putative FmdB family regulatory protein